MSKAYPPNIGKRHRCRSVESTHQSLLFLLRKGIMEHSPFPLESDEQWLPLELPLWDFMNYICVYGYEEGHLELSRKYFNAAAGGRYLCDSCEEIAVWCRSIHVGMFFFLCRGRVVSEWVVDALLEPLSLLSMTWRPPHLHPGSVIVGLTY